MSPPGGGGVFIISVCIRQLIPPSVVSAGNPALWPRLLGKFSSRDGNTRVSFLNRRGPAVGAARAKRLIKIPDAAALIESEPQSGQTRGTGIQNKWGGV